MPELRKYYSATLPPEEVLRDIAACYPQVADAVEAIFTKLELLQEANDAYAAAEDNQPEPPHTCCGAI